MISDADVLCDNRPVRVALPRQKGHSVRRWAGHKLEVRIVKGVDQSKEYDDRFDVAVRLVEHGIDLLACALRLKLRRSTCQSRLA